MGLFDKFKKKQDAENKSVTVQTEQSDTVSEEPARPSLLERLQGGEPIFTDH